MKVYVLTTEDGGDNELFCGVITNIDKVKNRSWYTIYEVEVDSEFDTDSYGTYVAPTQNFTIIK
jgi:hypothetical protein